MSTEKLKIGVIMPLVVNSYLGRTDLFPQAIVTNETTDTVLGTFDLAHVANGLYRNLDNVYAGGIVSVIYKTYEDAAHTILVEDHSDMLDLFLLEQSIPVAGSLTMVERLEAKFRQNNRIRGVVASVSLRGIIRGVQRMRGEVLQSRISGKISQTKIIGIVRDC